MRLCDVGIDSIQSGRLICGALQGPCEVDMHSILSGRLTCGALQKGPTPIYYQSGENCIWALLPLPKPGWVHGPTRKDVDIKRDNYYLIF